MKSYGHASLFLKTSSSVFLRVTSYASSRFSGIGAPYVSLVCDEELELDVNVRDLFLLVAGDIDEEDELELDVLCFLDLGGVFGGDNGCAFLFFCGCEDTFDVAFRLVVSVFPQSKRISFNFFILS